MTLFNQVNQSLNQVHSLNVQRALEMERLRGVLDKTHQDHINAQQNIAALNRAQNETIHSQDAEYSEAIVGLTAIMVQSNALLSELVTTVRAIYAQGRNR